MRRSSRTLPFQGKGETGREAHTLLPVLPIAVRRLAGPPVGWVGIEEKREMATILLIGSDQTDQENLAATLRARGHSVLLTENWHFSSTDFNARLSSADIAIVDVTRLDEDSLRQLRHICLRTRQDQFPVHVLCYSRTFRGPRFELDIERLGARFVYAD
jgi:hypothetical protein